MSTGTLMTADELFAMADDGYRYELVRGELRRMPPAGSEHGAVGMRFSIRAGEFAVTQQLGEVFSADTGFRIAADPDTVRAPDFACVRVRRTWRPRSCPRATPTPRSKRR